MGNEARFFNHSCDPNCESVIEGRRVYIEAIRAIEPGEELTYDYQIQREDDDPPDIDAIFACRCGAPECRKTMLWPTKRRTARAKQARSGRNAGAVRRGAAKKKAGRARKGGRPR